MKKATARAVAQDDRETREDAIWLWSAALWIGALLYLLAAIHIR